MKSQLLKKKGFTLVQLLGIVVVVAILAVVAVPTIQRAKERNRQGEAKRIMRHLHEAQMRYYRLFGQFGYGSSEDGGSIEGEGFFTFPEIDDESFHFSYETFAEEDRVWIRADRKLDTTWEGDEEGYATFSDYDLTNPENNIEHYSTF